MGKPHSKLNMYDRAVFRICIQGELDARWFDYFRAQSVSIELDPAGDAITALLSEPMDQGALVGVINRLNTLGVPVISVECTSTS